MTTALALSANVGEIHFSCNPQKERSSVKSLPVPPFWRATFWRSKKIYQTGPLNPCNAQLTHTQTRTPRELFPHEIKLSIITDYKLSPAMWQSAHVATKPGKFRRRKKRKFEKGTRRISCKKALSPRALAHTYAHKLLQRQQHPLLQHKALKYSTQSELERRLGCLVWFLILI